MKAFMIKHQNMAVVVVLFVVNFLWFVNFKFHTLMGDDLYTWNVIHNYKEGIIQYTLFETIFGKYRPVYNLIQYLVLNMFGLEYRLYFFLNIFVNFVVTLVMYRLLVHITKSVLTSVMFSLVFITCRFSYYNILQVYGLMEAIALVLFLLMLLVSIYFYRNPTKTNIFSIVLIETLLIFTHERYIVVVPFLVMLLFLFMQVKKKYYFAILPLLPVILNILIKKMIVNTSFLEGTGGMPISFDIKQIVIFLCAGLLNMVGVNVGAPYLNGINFTQENTLTQVLSIIILLVFLFLLVRLLRDGIGTRENKKNIIIVVLAFLLIVSLLIAASITIRQEYRWLYAPYAVFLLVTAFLISKFNIKQSFKVILVAVLCILILKNDIYYKSFLDRVFFVDALKIANSTYDVTIRKYGTSIKNMNIYIKKDPALVWTLQDDVFFKVHADAPNLKVNYVDDLAKINLSQGNLLLLQLSPNSRMMEDVTANFVTDQYDRKPQTILPEEWAIPDLGYAQTTIYGQKLYYKIINKIHKYEGISIIRKDNNKIIPISEIVSGNNLLKNLEPGKVAYYAIDSEFDFLWISVPAEAKINWEIEINTEKL